MPGPCVGCGLDTTDGTVNLHGPVTRDWPYGPDATVPDNNGLFCDPLRGLWVAPEMLVVSDALQENGRTVVPGSDATIPLDDLAVSLGTPLRSNSLVRYDVTGGYAGFRMATANWWVLKRYITLFKDTVPTSYSSNEVVNTVENNSGGILSMGGPVDAQGWWEVVAAGTVLRLEARYELEVSAFTANAANGLVWRPPRLSIMAASIPQQ